MDDRAKKFSSQTLQLRKRWQCSKMHLWRLRQRGKLCKPIKLGGDGRNLTPASSVIQLEVSQCSPK